MCPQKSNIVAADIEGRVARGALPESYRIVNEGSQGRSCITDPQSGKRWLVGAQELMLLCSFDGYRTYGEIQQRLHRQIGKKISLERIQEFETKLLGNALLVSKDFRINPDPFTGFHFGWFHRLIVIKLVEGNPEPLLNWVISVAPWLTSRAFVITAGIFTMLMLSLAAHRAPYHAQELTEALSGWGLLYFYAVAISSAVFHEGGHALACRRYGVGVIDMGVSIYFLLPFAWTRPEPDSWHALNLRKRTIAICAGPFGSLLFAALGAVVWILNTDGQGFGVIGLYVMVAGLFGAVHTMVPIFNGDGYLLIVEVFGLPNLRRRAFEHLRSTLATPSIAARIALRQRLLYLGVSLGTIVGMCATLVLVIWSIFTLSMKSTGL